MKKLLILLLLSTSLSTFADSDLDFTLSDFCYEHPKVQYRNGIYYLPNEELGISALSICVYKDAYGQYQSRGALKNGKKEGRWTDWFKNGQKMFEADYTDGEFSGKWTGWYENGWIWFENNYKCKGKNDCSWKDGKSTEWNKNGVMEFEDNYKDGEYDGISTSWYENGQKSSEVNFKKGELDGKLTYWHENGQKVSEENYKDGKKDGEFISWNENGQIKFIKRYKDDKKDGKWYSWYENGESKFIGHYKDDKKNWAWTEWNKNGNKTLTLYKDGVCEWEDDCPVEQGSASLVIEDQLSSLKSAYVNNIAARVKTFWRYQGAEDDWTCDVYVQQSVEGVVESVNVQNCTLDDSDQARAFKNSIERAIYKSSPLPSAPDDAVFDREIMFTFRSN